jgi:tetratricopeptide (TPR) repeat protein
LGAKGVEYIAAKQIQEGYRCFEQVYEIAQEIGDSGLESDALGSMGMVYLDTGDPAVALEKLKEALSIAQEIKDRNREMTQLGNLGNVYLHIAAGEEAVRYISQALEIATELGDKQSQAGYLNNLATLDKNAKHFEKAAQQFERVRQLTRELGDIHGERNALRHLITIYSDNIVKNDLVLLYLRRAIALSQQLDDYDAEIAYQDALILALLSLNRTREALDLLDGALQDERLADWPDRRMHLLVNRGNACFDNDRLADAFAAYEQALKLSVRRQNWKVEARMLGRLGAVEAERGHLETAVAYAQQAIEKAERNEDKRLIGEQYCMLALANRDLGNRSEAIANCEQAVKILEGATVDPLKEKSARLLEELLLEA